MPGGEDKHYWALLVGPAAEDGEMRGKRLYTKYRNYRGMQSVWEFSEQETGAESIFMILVCI
ncbi:uncharacterized protein FRV6_11473 [Fusarium oxysporum]|uniref:Uncharacterized protein n=1 Tax=Fusarium oxysporum TaxID=5507 RepID=A0A2H3TVL3_FUSOX|nr:uncharacterized protein FRV6_11473 [Fusarium oxysporum]